MSGFCVSCGAPVEAEELRCPACVPSTKDEIWPKSEPPATSDEEATVAPKRRHNVIHALLILAMVALASAIVLPNYTRRYARGHATACKSNIKNIGTALEMYSVDNEGHFPPSLARLTPNYLLRIPCCTGFAGDSYSGGYAVATVPSKAYTVVCSGENHRSVNWSANFPQYTSSQGLLER